LVALGRRQKYTADSKTINEATAAAVTAATPTESLLISLVDCAVANTGFAVGAVDGRVVSIEKVKDLCINGLLVGVTVGLLGLREGVRVGFLDGVIVGFLVGLVVGDCENLLVGALVGTKVGRAERDGRAVGWAEG